MSANVRLITNRPSLKHFYTSRGRLRRLEKWHSIAL
jgi:hypothetical protein